MGLAIFATATLQCSFGMMPSTLIVLPDKLVLSKTPMANIMDSKPMLNILPFGMCTCQANPAVAAATAAKLGVATPSACIPLTPAPWIPGSPTVLVKNFPALNNSSKLICAYGGIIQIVAPSQADVLVP